MKTLKSFLVVSMVLLSCSVFAQPPGGGRGGGGGERGGGGEGGPPSVPSDKQIEKMVTKLSKELLLNDDQEAKILTLYQNHFSDIETKMSSSERPEREEMEALETAFQESVKKELIEEQIPLYEAYIEEQNQQRSERQR